MLFCSWKAVHVAIGREFKFVAAVVRILVLFLTKSCSAAAGARGVNSCSVEKVMLLLLCCCKWLLMLLLNKREYVDAAVVVMLLKMVGDVVVVVVVQALLLL